MSKEPKTLKVLWLSCCQRFTLPHDSYMAAVTCAFKKTSKKTNKIIDDIFDEIIDNDIPGKNIKKLLKKLTKFSRKKRQVRKLCFNNRDLLILFTNKNSFCAFRVFITGFLPFTLRAALRAFKNFPEIFVAATTYKKLCVLCAFAPLR